MEDILVSLMTNCNSLSLQQTQIVFDFGKTKCSKNWNTLTHVPFIFLKNIINHVNLIVVM